MKSAEFGDLSGQIAVVTGSSSGIGRAIAVEFAKAGADILVHCRTSTSEAETVAADIRALGRAADVLCADLADVQNLAPLVDKAWNRFGRVDVWVNNAGADVLTGEQKRLDYEEKLTQLLEIDVRGTILLSRTVGQRMTEVGHGVILNVGWDQAERGMGGASGELFGASKNAVMGFTRSLAVSLAPNVRVNCIAPGWIRTEWGETASDYWQERVRTETPLARWGTPEDVARLARFLASSDAGFVTGQVIRVNGGAVR